jgi:hypothetical protein
VPPDPTFPDTAFDPVTRKVTPLQDNPFTRAAHAASKLFEDAAQRIGFMYRLQALMPIALSTKYDQCRNDGAGTTLPRVPLWLGSAGVLPGPGRAALTGLAPALQFC